MTPRPSRASLRTRAARIPGSNTPSPSRELLSSQEDLLPIALGAVLLGFISLMVCYAKGYILLYGDAVAHLGIARRILDSRNPGLPQLGGVWLPLPHLLMLPFVQKMEWWHNGLAGAWPSLACYIVGAIGFYRLSLKALPPRWALAALVFYALNPNLLYLSTTAMTEPLFLALLIWITLLTLECCAAVQSRQTEAATRRMLGLGLLIVGAVFTRYDGWILGAAVWCIVARSLWLARDIRRKLTSAFAIFTLLAIAGPLLWLWYNQHFFHDPLDFMRGPYSAPAIERRTAPPGSKHYRGWHNPGWSLLFYTRTAQVDAAVWETGFALMVAALAGAWLGLRRRIHPTLLLLWLPLPFYVYSVAYGSVPIFIPQLYPHSYYNSRYGMELLPALALYGWIALAALERRLAAGKTRAALAARILQPAMLALAILNCLGMMYRVPLVLKEAQVNSSTRAPFERDLAEVIGSFTPGEPILMKNSDYIGALQDASIPLRQTLNEGDYTTWRAALDDPAGHAAYVIAIAGDPVSDAVTQHPDGLVELQVLCVRGQPCARIYQSQRYAAPGTHSTP